jgi:hypothetical protein
LTLPDTASEISKLAFQQMPNVPEGKTNPTPSQQLGVRFEPVIPQFKSPNKSQLGVDDRMGRLEQDVSDIKEAMKLIDRQLQTLVQLMQDAVKR